MKALLGAIAGFPARSKIVLSRCSRLCRAHGGEDKSKAIVDTEERRQDAVPDEYLLIKDLRIALSGLGENAKPIWVVIAGTFDV